MMKRLFSAVVAAGGLLLLSVSTLAQGTIGAGHVLCNPSASERTATDCTITQFLDQAISSSNDSFAARFSGSWQAATITSFGRSLVLAANAAAARVTLDAASLGTANTFSALNQFTDVKFSSGKLYPTSNSTTAIQVCQADGTTCFIRADTTNQRLGIGGTPGAFALDVTGAMNVSGTFTFGTLSATSLGASTSTVTGLTVNNSPTASNDYVPYYSAADGAIRKITVAALASAATAGVSSLNGLTGGLSITQGTGIAVSAAGSSVTVALTTARQTLPTRQVFLSGSGTYTTPANVLWIQVELVGGGGGGAGSGTTPGSGGNGGNTTFSTLTANFGTGAAATVNGVGGSAACGGDYGITGGNGSQAVAGANLPGGAGANSFYGGGGGVGAAGSANTGGGGGGAVASSTANPGGGGGAGQYCNKIITSPAATYSYGVGAAGAAGTSGSGGFAGTAGGSGRIIVTEYYGS